MVSSVRSAFLAWLPIGLALTACGEKVIVTNPVRRPPLVEEASAGLGVYYGSRLRTHSCIVNKGYIAAEWLISLGPASIDMFNRVLDALFSEVTVLANDPRATRPRADEGFVVLDLEAFDGCEAEWPITGSTTMKVMFNAEFFAANGDRLGRLMVRGTAGPADYRSGPTLKVEARYLSDLTEAALRRAAADFIVQVDRNPKIQHWIQGKATKP